MGFLSSFHPDKELEVSIPIDGRSEIDLPNGNRHFVGKFIGTSNENAIFFDVNGKVNFYDHNQEQMCQDNFVHLGLDFQKWLHFADLNKQLDEIYDNNINISENDKLLYKHRLKEISELSFADYPFEI